MVLLLFLLLPQALAHTGRPINEDPALTQVLLALGLLFSGWTMVHFSSQALKLPRRDFRQKGPLPTILACTGSLCFAVLSWSAVQPKGQPTALLVEQDGRWEVHQQTGLHSQSTLLLAAGRPQTLTIQSQRGTTFQVPALQVNVTTQAGQTVQVPIKASQVGSYPTSIPSIIVQVLPAEHLQALQKGQP